LVPWNAAASPIRVKTRLALMPQDQTTKEVV
jgi:hypothetical protein